MAARLVLKTPQQQDPQSIRTTSQYGSTCCDTSTQSDLSSDIASECVDQGSSHEYEIQGLIGTGKFSQVYVARHKESQVLVALKKVQVFEIMDTKARLDCIREVKILQSLEHKNIVKCYTSFLENNELSIVMEWAEAGDFANVLRQRREANAMFSITEVLHFFKQLCAALHHMHERRIMHRDLKPSNIFLTSDGLLKLGDLGLSRHFSSKTVAACSVVGTPYYMSPECIRGQPYAFSSDIWSLGCLLYEMITLRNPFYKEGLNFYLLGKLITAATYDPLPPTCPPPLAHLVTCMLQPDPHMRPSIGAVHQYVDGMLSSPQLSAS